MTPRIIVVGSSNTDLVMKVGQLPAPGETVLGGRFSTAAGGKGANQAVAAARAGASVTFIAALGDDAFGRQAREAYAHEGIDFSRARSCARTPSGIAVILVDDGGENSIAVASGANMELAPADVAVAGDVIASADALLTQLEIPLETVCAAVQAARSAGVPVILNPAPAQPLDEHLLQQIDVITPNEHEAGMLTGLQITDDVSAHMAAMALTAKGARSVIITLGERGAYVASPEFTGLVPSFQVNAVDTTAAGDVFNGALAVALAEKKSLYEAVRFAHAAAALSVTKMGAQPSIPTRAEVEALLARGGQPPQAHA